MGNKLKQNYTMLDNLKLGYGGTKEEMQRLLEDAEKLSGQKFDISSYADVVDAIHVVQTEMGITGTTAKEAASTISGSLSSMKSSWANLLTGMADENADFGALVTNFGDSLTNVFKNLVPRIGVALGGMAKLVEQLAPIIYSELPKLAQSLIPAVISGAVSLIKAVTSALPSIMNVLTTDVLPALISGLKDVISGIISALPSLISSLCSALPSLVSVLLTAVIDLILVLCVELPKAIQPIIDMLPALLESILTAVLSNLDVILQGLIDLCVALIPMIPQIITILIDALTGMYPQLVTMAIMELLPVVIVGLGQLIWEICKALPSLLKSLVDILFLPFKQWWTILTTFLSPIIEWFGDLWDKIGKVPALAALKKLIEKVWNSIKERINKNIELLKKLVKIGFEFIQEKIITPITKAKNKAVEIFNNIRSAISERVNALRSLISKVFTAIKERITTPINDAKNRAINAFNNIKSRIVNIVNSIKNTVSNVFGKIKTAMTTPINKAKEAISSVVSKIKGLFSGLSIKMPKIKTPHFAISPKGWKIGDLLDGKIPKLAIDWYAKAMNNPLLLNKPTVFGYDSASGKLLGGGEKGAEVVAGANTLMGMISGAVESQMSGMTDALVSVLTAILNAILSGNNNTLQALANGQKIVLDRREVARVVREYA